MNARIVPAVTFIHGSIGATRVQMITLRFIGGSEMKLCIWFVCVSPALCISPRRELSLNSHRSSTFFFLRLWHCAPPGECPRPPLWEPLLYRIKYKSVQWWVVFFMHLTFVFMPVLLFYFCCIYLPVRENNAYIKPVRGAKKVGDPCFSRRFCPKRRTRERTIKLQAIET